MDDQKCHMFVFLYKYNTAKLSNLICCIGPMVSKVINCEFWGISLHLGLQFSVATFAKKPNPHFVKLSVQF